MSTPWTAERLEALFAPRSIALVGASERSNWARMLVGALERAGFAGPVELVNGRGGEAFGRPAFPRLSDIGRPVDLAYLMVPAEAVLDAIADGRDAGVRNFVVLTAGFAEVGEAGREAQDGLRRLAEADGLAVLGPNTLGYINVTDGVSLMPNPLPGLPRRGGVGLVTQSGALAGAALRYCEGQRIGVSKVVALGNEVVIGIADVMDYLVEDPHTTAVAVMMEAIRSPEDFMTVARRALEAGKPVVALKMGRSEAGARVGAAHTGAMVEDDRVVDAAFRQLGVIRVSSVEALMTTASVLARLDRPLAGNRLAVLGISGGACNVIADRADDEGVWVEPFNDATRAALEPLVSQYGAINNPLDVTGAAVTQPGLFSDIIGAVARSADADMMLIQHDVPSENSSSHESFGNILRAAANAQVPALVVGSVPQTAPHDDDRFPADAADRIVLSGMDLAVSALGHAAWWSERHGRASHRPGPVASVGATEPVTVDDRAPGAVWGEDRSRELLASAGFPLVPAAVVATIDDAVAAAEELGFPVVLKAVIPDVAHKSDVGGVELGIVDAEELRVAAKRMDDRLATAGLRAERFLVSPMRPAGVELIAGVVRKPVWGPVLAVGFGGTWAEVLSDNALRVLPVDAHDVHEMLGELRGASLLRTPRGLPPGDLDAVADAVLRLADLALSLPDDLESIEVNPLWVRGHQVEGLDALVTWQPTTESRPDHDNAH